MDSQIAHSHDHDPHNIIVEGHEDEHHHEKKSVIEKVKEKAKKIKNTITKHGHGRDHEDDYGQQDYHHDLDEEDEEDEETVEDSELEVPGAIRQGVMREDPSAPILDRSKAFSAGKYESSASTDPTKTYVSENAGKPKVNLERTGGLEEDPGAPTSRPGAYSSNYQTKVTDPTGRGGGEEAEITPILPSLGKMNIYDEPEQKHNNIPPGRSHIQFSYSSTGSHDQFSPELIPVETTALPEPQEGLPHGTGDEKTEQNQSSYTQKISSATSAIADKAISAKNVVASNLGYGEKEKDSPAEKQQTHEYDGGDKKISCTVTQKPTPVHDNAESGVKGKDKGVSVKDYFAEKLRPGAEDRALSEVISNALHKRARPTGKVTESEEVARRLGTEDEDNGQSSNVNSQGSSVVVVDKIKGAVRSWLGSKDESQQSLGSSNGNEGFSGPASREAGQEGEIGEQSLQEPGN